MSKPIRPEEIEIIGNWLEKDKKVVGDENCERVEWLVSNTLKKIGIHKINGSWDTLFQDSNDGRFWVRTYPHGDWHGGGPPALKCIDEATAKEEYNF